MSDALIADRLLAVERNAIRISLCENSVYDRIVVPGICDGDGVIRFYTPLGRWSSASAENGYAPLKLLRQTSSQPAVFYYSMLDKNDSGHTVSIWMPWGGDGPLRIVRDENDYHFLEITVPSPEGAVGGAVGLLKNRMELLCRCYIPQETPLPEDPVSNCALHACRGALDFVATSSGQTSGARDANTEAAAGLESYWLGAVIAGSSNTYVTMPNPSGASGLRGDMPKAKQAFTVYGATHKYERTQNSFSSTVKSNLVLLRKFGWGAKLTGIVRAPLDLVEDADIDAPWYGAGVGGAAEYIMAKQYCAVPAYVIDNWIYMLVAYDNIFVRRSGAAYVASNYRFTWEGGVSAMLRDDGVDKPVLESAFTHEDGDAKYTHHPGGITIAARLRTATQWSAHACIVSTYSGGLQLYREAR